MEFIYILREILTKTSISLFLCVTDELAEFKGFFLINIVNF